MPSNSEQPKKHIPRVSIGMPVYNGNPFIRKALDSLLAQTFTDFELIISDNASTDGTETICRDYAAHDSRIIYIRQKENRGPIWNFRFVLNQAHGEYFMWAAADDARDKYFLELAVKVLDCDPRVGLSFSDMITKNIFTNTDKGYYSCGFTTHRSKLIRFLFRLFNGCPSLIYGLCRREILLKIPIYEFDYYDLYLSHWFELESTIKVVPLPLFFAGEKGERLPYSLTDTMINYRPYLKAEYELLKKHFKFPLYLVPFFINWWFIHKATKIANKRINKNL